jgi:hypothetical protein
MNELKYLKELYDSCEKYKYLDTVESMHYVELMQKYNLTDLDIKNLKIHKDEEILENEDKNKI